MSINLNPLHFVQGLFHSNPQQQKSTPPVQKINLAGGQPIQQQITPDPRIWQPQAGHAIQNAEKTLGLTNQFAQNLLNAYPKVGAINPSTALTNSSGAAAEYFNGNTQANQIALGQGYGQSPITVLHEGLHREWDNNPQDKQQFIKQYDASSTPQLRQYLQMRVSPYAAAKPLMDEGGVYTNDFKKLESLPASLQNEIHSYIPEYYSSVVPNQNAIAGVHFEDGSVAPSQKLPGYSPGLSQYYSQYYNPKIVKKVQALNRGYGRGR